MCIATPDSYKWLKDSYNTALGYWKCDSVSENATILFKYLYDYCVKHCECSYNIIYYNIAIWM